MTDRAYAHSIEEIKARLNAVPVQLANRLGLYGRQQGPNYWVRDYRRQDGGNFTSFSINTARGFWKDFSTDKGGDLIKLIAVYACNGDNGRAIKWALDFLGLTNRAPDPAEAERLLERQRKLDSEELERAKKRRAAAQRLWLEAKPLDGTDPASLYLKARGIDVLQLKEGIPNALRFHPACLAQPERYPLPTMIACVSCEGRGNNGFMAAHRTYLAQYEGKWGKAFNGLVRNGKPVPAKRVLGEFAGGSIRLTRGASGKPLRQALAGEWPQIAEGIENALTGAIAMPELRTLAGVSLSNLGNIELPPAIGGVYILADNDTRPETIAAFDRAMDRFLERGIEPAIVRAPGVKDFNAVLQGAA